MHPSMNMYVRDYAINMHASLWSLQVVVVICKWHMHASLTLMTDLSLLENAGVLDWASILFSVVWREIDMRGCRRLLGSYLKKAPEEEVDQLTMNRSFSNACLLFVSVVVSAHFLHVFPLSSLVSSSIRILIWLGLIWWCKRGDGWLLIIPGPLFAMKLDHGELVETLLLHAMHAHVFDNWFTWFLIYAVVWFMLVHLK